MAFNWSTAVVVLVIWITGITPLILLILANAEFSPFWIRQTIVYPEKTIKQETIKETVIINNITTAELPDATIECIKVYKPGEKDAQKYELMCSKK